VTGTAGERRFEADRWLARFEAELDRHDRFALVRPRTRRTRAEVRSHAEDVLTDARSAAEVRERLGDPEALAVALAGRERTRTALRRLGLAVALATMLAAAAALIVRSDVPPHTSLGSSAGSESRGEISRTSSLRLPRAAHTATRLADGRVLIAGGCTLDGCEGTERGRRAELFDPRRGRFDPAGSMAVSRVSHTATRLPGGRVLIAGGYSGEGGQPLRSAEVFDPAGGGFRRVGPMRTARADQVAVRLADGRVLIAGGSDGRRELASAELFDPRRERFLRADSLSVARSIAAAVRLADGRVLIAGGSRNGERALASAEVYAPGRDRWTPTGSMSTPRIKHAAVLLADGRVLVTGGSPSQDFDDRLASAELYHPGSGRFEPAPERMRSARFKLSGGAAALSSDSALIAAGARRAEVFSGRTMTFTETTGEALAGYLFSTATPLPGGRILVAGGYDDAIDVHGDAYVYGPPRPANRTVAPSRTLAGLIPPPVAPP
jgi:Kelch motif